jgi:hypothetical protein
MLTFICGKCCLFLTINLAFLVIGIMIGDGSSQIYGVVV